MFSISHLEIKGPDFLKEHFKTIKVIKSKFFFMVFEIKTSF